MRTITNTTTHPAKINELLAKGAPLENIQRALSFATLTIIDGVATAAEYRSRPDQGRGTRALGLVTPVPAVSRDTSRMNHHEAAAHGSGSSYGVDGGVWDD